MPNLPPPAPSSSLVTTPLDAAATGHADAMMVVGLPEEAAEEDVRPAKKRRPSSAAETKERLERLRSMTRQYARMRRDMDDANDKSVALPGNTAGMIPKQEPGGRPLGVEEDGAERRFGLYGGSVPRRDQR